MNSNILNLKVGNYYFSKTEPFKKVKYLLKYSLKKLVKIVKIYF